MIISSDIEFVDSHCHLPLIADNWNEVDAIVERATSAKVRQMLCVSIDLEGVDKVLHCANRYDNVLASIGVHPQIQQNQKEPDVDILCSLLEKPKVVATGETGLDFFHNDSSVEEQINRFKTHIKAALITKKPLIIHCREAAEKTLEILRKENAKQVGGIMHCFVENWEVAQAAMDLGFYISFSGIITFKSAVDLQSVAKKIPISKLLVETDSPYLAPVPLRGKTNEPSNVVHTANFLSVLRDESIENIAKKTTDNFFSLFPMSASLS